MKVSTVVKRKTIEELLIILGIIGLVLTFQPFNILGYTIGWIMLLSCTLTYVIFTLIPRSATSGRELVKIFIKTLLIVLAIVVSFIVVSILLTPNIM